MNLITYDNSERGKRCAELLRSASTNYEASLGAEKQVYLLPIPSVRGGKIVGTEIVAEEFFSTVAAGCVIIGYGLSEYEEGLRMRGCFVVDAACDEDFLHANATLTANAALGILLTTEKRAPSELSVGVCGYGRIGRAISAPLIYLGCRVKIFTGKERTLLELCECGVPAARSCADADLSGLDVLINTAPTPIFSALAQGVRVMELASGDNFPAGVAEKYPSLPSKYYPESAGRIYAEAALRALSHPPRGNENE